MKPLQPHRLLPFPFFFNDTATTEIYTLSLHDALPISVRRLTHSPKFDGAGPWSPDGDRKSTRLNSSHGSISYAVFCLKKKKTACRALPRRLHRAHTAGAAFRVAALGIPESDVDIIVLDYGGGFGGKHCVTFFF